MNTNEEMVEEFFSNFPTKNQIIKDFEFEGHSIWNFTEYFKFTLLKALQAKDQQARLEKIEMVESVPSVGGWTNADNLDRAMIIKWKQEQLNKLNP